LETAVPSVSVIVPTRDRPLLLARALASIRAQTLGEVEVVVVDDGDGRSAAALRAEGRPGIRAVSTGGAGQVAARRQGVAIAQGEILAFLDDDDWWEEEDHLARLVTGWSGPRLRHLGGAVVRETEAMVALERLPFRPDPDPAALRQDNTLLVSGLAFDRRAYAVAGEFDSAFPHYWDWDFYLALLGRRVPIEALAGGGVCVSARAGTVSSDSNETARRDELDRLAAKHGLGPIPLKNHLSIALDQQHEKDLSG
jgi:glycosyltransferase involved in cell wall biosynthesis